MSTINIKRGDTRWGPAGKAKNPKGGPADFTNAEVTFVMSNSRREILIEREAIIIDAENGRIAFAFEAGETDRRGTYKGEFKIVYPDGSTGTFPNVGYILIVID